MAGSDDIALRLMRTLVFVDSAILPKKTQLIFGPPVPNLTGSGTQFVNNVKRMATSSPLLNPLCGQSGSSTGSFGIQKWLSCCLAQGQTNNHCNGCLLATVNHT